MSDFPTTLAERIHQELEAGPPARGWPELTPEAAANVRWMVGPYAMHPATPCTTRPTPGPAHPADTPEWHPGRAALNIAPAAAL